MSQIVTLRLCQIAPVVRILRNEIMLAGIRYLGEIRFGNPSAVGVEREILGKIRFLHIPQYEQRSGPTPQINLFLARHMTFVQANEVSNRVQSIISGFCNGLT